MLFLRSLISILLFVSLSSLSMQWLKDHLNIVASAVLGSSNSVSVADTKQDKEVDDSALSPSEKCWKLYIAAQKGDLYTIRYWISQGANINFCEHRYGSLNYNALMWACYRGDLEIVEFLLSNDKQKEKPTMNGSDIKIIIEAPNTSTNSANKFIEKKQNIEGSEINIGQKLDINFRNKTGQTALMAACSNPKGSENRLKIVKLLLNNGAGIHMQDEAGNSALHFACINGHTEIVKLLLSCPTIDINLKNKKGKTALQIVLKLVEVLARDHNDDLISINYSKYFELLKLFLAYDAQIEYDDIDIVVNNDRYGYKLKLLLYIILSEINIEDYQKLLEILKKIYVNISGKNYLIKSITILALRKAADLNLYIGRLLDYEELTTEELTEYQIIRNSREFLRKADKADRKASRE